MTCRWVVTTSRRSAAAEAVDRFATFVQRERELADLLAQALERDQQMFADMRGAQG